jgi:serine/threonine protein phosphatase 1
MGNHEELALAAAAGNAESASHWLRNGGDAALRSYGVADARNLPATHVGWLRALRLSHDDGLRFFVHAGVDPALPLDRQAPHDLRWIREPFLMSERDYGRLIVHGHTPVMTGTPDLRSNRLNIDTGAGWGGPLTAAVFTADESGPIAFFQAME